MTGGPRISALRGGGLMHVGSGGGLESVATFCNRTAASGRGGNACEVMWFDSSNKVKSLSPRMRLSATRSKRQELTCQRRQHV